MLRRVKPELVSNVNEQIKNKQFQYYKEKIQEFVQEQKELADFLCDSVKDLVPAERARTVKLTLALYAMLQQQDLCEELDEQYDYQADAYGGPV